VRRTLLRTLALLLLVLAGFYLAAVGYLYVAQRSYVFAPGGNLRPPAELGLQQVQVITLNMPDGVALTSWYAQARPGQPTLLYFHGNAGNLSDRADRFREVLGSGFGLLAVSYRGYPGSGGVPSEAALFSDALTTFDRLAKRTDNIVLHGESLGTGVATYVASQRKARALVLEAPYTAALDIAATTYPWVPVGWLMRDPFLTRDYILKVEEPVLIAHGTQDRVIPVEHGRRLFDLALDPKQLAIFDGAGHSDLWDHGLWRKELAFLAKNRAAALPLTTSEPSGHTAYAAVRRTPSLAGL
jgi:fermentation-respiration switch protein FrsA (DUF1100 family)